MHPFARFAMALTLGAAMTTVAHAAAFTLTAPSIFGKKLGEAQVYNEFGCSGQNKSPALAWKGAPAGTKSYAVTAYDPDAPTGSGWWHWVVYNLPVGTQELAEGAGTADGAKLPAGSAQGRTDFGSVGYGGACPPEGDQPHRYIFTVYALKVDKLPVALDATAALVGFVLNANKLATATFTATYGR